MGSSFSTSNDEGSGPITGLGDLPENCLATILANLDPPDICNLARTNKAFHRASTADFIWEPKLPENYRTLAEKLMFYKGYSEACLVKKEVYAGLCSPVRFSSGTKEVWLDKEKGGICMLVSWKEMKITGIDDRRYWTHIPTLQSRFHAIAYLQQIWWLEVEGDLDFSIPAGSYSLFFRLRLGRPSEGQDRKSSSTTQQVHGWNIKPVRFQFSVHSVGEFVIEDSYKPTKIKFSMTQIDCTHQKGGLALDSVFICRNKLEIGR